MKIIAVLLLLCGAPLAAQTLEQRADKIIADANLAENAMQRVMAEASRLTAPLRRRTHPPSARACLLHLHRCRPYQLQTNRINT